MGLAVECKSEYIEMEKRFCSRIPSVLFSRFRKTRVTGFVQVCVPIPETVFYFAEAAEKCMKKIYGKRTTKNVFDRLH